MILVIHNFTFVKNFNETVKNVKSIIREARHMGCGYAVINEMNKFAKFMDDVNFKMDFVNDPETYVRGKMLDAMDYLKDNFLDNGPLSKHHEMKGYRVINSVYDCINEFYFNNLHLFVI